MKVTQMPPVHAANLVVNSGKAAYGVDVISTGPTPLASQFPIGPVNRALPLARVVCGNFVDIVLCQLFGPVKPGLGQ